MEKIELNENQKILKNFFIIILGSLALTISAKIKIPFYPVPMTMQTFVVLLLGITFGYKIGLATISVYLLEGILGHSSRYEIMLSLNLLKNDYYNEIKKVCPFLTDKSEPSSFYIVVN